MADFRPQDRWETLDGSRPLPVHLSPEVAKAFPIGAFLVLRGGDVFEDLGGRPPPDGPSRAAAAVKEKVTLVPHGAPAAQQAKVTNELARMLSGNLSLLERMRRAPPLEVTLIPEGGALARYGFPAQVVPSAIGLFWHQPGWEKGRIALRQEALETEPALVFHEMAHAIHALAFTAEERSWMDKVLGRTWKRSADRDEVFAIYSEREFLEAYGDQHFRVPGVYGAARQRWNEEHLFTRFVRNLYFPYKPLAGPPGPKLGGV